MNLLIFIFFIVINLLGILNVHFILKANLIFLIMVRKNYFDFQKLTKEFKNYFKTDQIKCDVNISLKNYETFLNDDFNQ
jgi:hypothetical protein